MLAISAQIDAPLHSVWTLYTEPEHVKAWNRASADWHTPQATNDLRPGGSFNYRMEALDGSFGFDFTGTYDAVEAPRHIAYTMPDGRKVDIRFAETAGGTSIQCHFDPENENPIDMQQQGWQAILDSFKAYAERQHPTA